MVTCVNRYVPNEENLYAVRVGWKPHCTVEAQFEQLYNHCAKKQATCRLNAQSPLSVGLETDCEARSVANSLAERRMVQRWPLSSEVIYEKGTHGSSDACLVQRHRLGELSGATVVSSPHGSNGPRTPDLR